nr:hypothetical protein [Tanacetum cinerariifolium]
MLWSSRLNVEIVLFNPCRILELFTGYEHPNTTPETESDEIIKSVVEELVPILSEKEVTSEDKKEFDLIDVRESNFCSEEIENVLNDDSIPIGIENFVFNMEEDIFYIERLLSEDPFPSPPINPNQIKSSIEEPEHSFSIGYEHFSTTLVMELYEVAESSTKNLVPIPRECDVTSNDEIESNEPVKDDSPTFTTFLNPLFNNSDDFTSNEDDVPIEESKVHLNLLFNNDEINSNELESHVESNFVESLSNHDTLVDSSQRIDHFEDRMEILFTINPRPHPTVNANTNVESIPSSFIPIQDNDSQREEIDIATNTDELLPPGLENNDSDGEIDAFEELHVDNSISNSEMSYPIMEHPILITRYFHDLLRNHQMLILILR